MYSPIAWKDFGWYHVESLPSFHCIIKHFVVSKNQNRRHVPNTGKYLLKKHIAFVAWRLFFSPLSSDDYVSFVEWRFYSHKWIWVSCRNPSFLKTTFIFLFFLFLAFRKSRTYNYVKCAYFSKTYILLWYVSFSQDQN